jgi:hypothetical protein
VKNLPILFCWHEVSVIDDYGQVTRRWIMDPLPRYANMAKKQFAENEEYPLVPHEVRNRKHHNFFFAAVQEGFVNLPENVAARFPTPDHLRRWLLIDNGWFDEKEFDFEGRDAHVQARRIGAFIRTEDSYAKITVHKTSATKSKIIVRRAKSQAEDAMGKADFEASSTAVLEALAGMIGVKASQLKKEAGNHA